MKPISSQRDDSSIRQFLRQLDDLHNRQWTQLSNAAIAYANNIVALYSNRSTKLEETMKSGFFEQLKTRLPLQKKATKQQALNKLRSDFLDQLQILEHAHRNERDTLKEKINSDLRPFTRKKEYTKDYKEICLGLQKNTNLEI